MPSLKGARILLVEPDILLAVQLVQELIQHGTAAPVVAPTLSRVRTAAAADWEAMVVDPVSDEGCVLTAIQPILERRVPLIITSHRPRTSQPLELASGAFLRKPYTTPALVSAVSAAIMGQPFVNDRPGLY